MPLLHSGSKQAIATNIREMINAGRPHKQAIAAALDTARMYGKRRAAGGSAGAPTAAAAPTAPTYATASPSVLPSGLMQVPQVGAYTLDPTTGALTPGAQQALQQYAQRGLTITGAPSAASASTSAPPPAATLPAAELTDGSGNYAAQQDIPYQPATGGNARGGQIKPKLAQGGVPTSSEMAPWFTRTEAHGETSPSGLVHGIGPGRTDTVPMALAAGSHVIPADVVSGLGEGNTLAGARTMDVAIHSGPGGIRLPSGPSRSTIPRPPSLSSGKFARGGEPNWEGHSLRLARGGAPGGVKCIVANGEYIMAPDEVQRTKHNGKVGHDAVDDWIVERRKATVQKLKSLPGPVKS